MNNEEFRNCVADYKIQPIWLVCRGNSRCGCPVDTSAKQKHRPNRQVRPLPVPKVCSKPHSGDSWIAPTDIPTNYNLIKKEVALTTSVLELETWLEHATCSLRMSCSTNWAIPAYYFVKTIIFQQTNFFKYFNAIIIKVWYNIRNPKGAIFYEQ